MFVLLAYSHFHTAFNRRKRKHQCVRSNAPGKKTKYLLIDLQSWNVCSVIFNGLCVCVGTGGTWWGSRARWWATSLSPSTSRASSWAACTTLIISPGPCTSALQTSNTYPSSSLSTGPCSAVNTPRHLTSASSHMLHAALRTNPWIGGRCGKACCWNSQNSHDTPSKTITLRKRTVQRRPDFLLCSCHRSTF